jgi:ribose transport system ATP-binding protein
VLRDGRSVASGMIGETTNDQLIVHMVGRAVLTPWPPLRSGEGERREGNVILAAHDISAPPVLKHASFELRRGEVLGIAGLMGSGRSELVRAVFGLEPRASGRLVLGGCELLVSGARPSHRVAQGLGYLSEDRRREGLALTLSVADNLTATRYAACSPGWGWLDLDRQRAAAAQWIDALHIRAAAVQPVRNLSGGNQQKVAIGRLLHQDAAVLLLDEPTRGIDVGSRAQIYEAIRRAAAQGKAVLLVSSYLPELFEQCDRLAVMSRGRLSPARPITEWTPETVLATAIGGLGDGDTSGTS